MICYKIFNLFVYYKKTGYKKVYTGSYKKCTKRAEKYKHKTSIEPVTHY